MKKKIKTLFLLGYLPEPRMYNRIKAAQEYSNVSLICWDRGLNMYPKPQIDKVHVRIITIPAVNNPLKRIIPYIRFKRIASKLVDKAAPDIIHVRNLDMLEIACDYKKKHKQVTIIYEVADIHRLLIDKQEGVFKKAAQKYLLFEDKRCGKKSDILIVSSEKYYDSYFHTFIPREKAIFIPNVPDLTVFDNYHKRETKDPLVVGFIGAIRYKRQIDNLIVAAKACGLKIMIAGYENGENEIEEKWSKDPDVEWVGRFDFDKQVADLYGRCNIMHSVYDADIENCRVALPNKLYEAVYCEMPLIVAKNTFLSQIVDDWGVGVSVDHNDVEELKTVFMKFKEDPTYFKQFEAGYKAHKKDIDIRQYNIDLRKLVEKTVHEKLT